MWKSIFLGLAVAALLSGRSVAQEPVELERALVRQAPGVIKKLKEKGYKNVGVLKFLAAKEGERLTDNVGTLNTLLAQRLELALMLANTPKDPVGIIENASAVAQKISEASHLSKDKRLKLFAERYPLAWGSEKVQPDAFVTGDVRVSGDLKVLTISLMAFDRAENTLAAILPDFTARNRPEQLVELGESFVLRGGFDDGQVKERHEVALATAQKVKSEAVKHPIHDPKAPVKLEILYDGRAVPIDIQDGVARAKEPEEGQRVEIVLRRGDTPARVKAVVKVNGENTIERQRLPDAQCWGWVLEANRTQPLELKGYQVASDVIEKFRVASRAESKAREMDYGADVGTITVSVFGERKGPAPKVNLLDEETPKVQVVSRILKPSVRPQNADALIQGLLADANRGLIIEGERVKSGKVVTTKFDLDPLPLMAVTVMYYKP